MSRTTRTLPRWVMKYIVEDNQLRNGYRERTWRDDFVSYRWKTEKLVIDYSTDNAQKDLYRCRNSVSNGKACGWNMQCAHTMLGKRIARKLWAKANRRHGKNLVQEQLRDYYDTELDWYDAQQSVDEYYDSEYEYDIFNVDDTPGYEDIADNTTYDRGYYEGYTDGYNAAIRDMTNATIKRTA